MLTKIALILAIVAGIAAAILGFTQIKPKIETIQTQLVDETAERYKQTKRAVKAESDFAKSQKDLKDEKSSHDNTRTQLARAKEDLGTAIADRQRVQGQLDQTKSNLDKARAELAAWAALQVPIERIKETLASLKVEKDKNEVLQGENKVLSQKVKTQQDFIDYLIGKKEASDETGVPMVTGMKAKVISVDPKWNFVILDIGKNQEAREGGNMLIYRDNKLIAKVKIRTVSDNSSVATIMQGWKLVDVQEGDLAIH